MKKRILLIIFAVCGYIGLSAQEYEYVPLVREGVEWGYNDRGVQDVDRSYHYRMEGDTLINGILYKKCYLYNTCDEEESILKGWVREQDKKVYLLANQEEWENPDLYYQLQNEVVLYDFTPEKPGDLMQGFEFDYTVKKIDTVLIDGTLRKQFYLDDLGVIKLIEGLGILQYGNLLYPFMPLESSITFVTTTLSYVKTNENHYEYNPYGNPCDEGAIEAISPLELRIAQYPKQWVVTLPSDDCRMVEVVDTTGRVAWCAYINGDDESVIIPTTNLAQGIYIVILTTRRGKHITCKVAL